MIGGQDERSEEPFFEVFDRDRLLMGDQSRQVVSDSVLVALHVLHLQAVEMPLQFLDLAWYAAIRGSEHWYSLDTWLMSSCESPLTSRRRIPREAATRRLASSPLYSAMLLVASLKKESHYVLELFARWRGENNSSPRA